MKSDNYLMIFKNKNFEKHKNRVIIVSNFLNKNKVINTLKHKNCQQSSKITWALALVKFWTRPGPSPTPNIRQGLMSAAG